MVSTNVPDVQVDVHLSSTELSDALAADVRSGLTRVPKELPPKWFYDDRGSELFDAITRLPEYYPTRAERAILGARASEIAAAARADTLVELGSGTSEKTRLLLDALRDHGTLRRFVPFDVSEATLRTAADAIADEYGVAVHAVVGDFERHLDRLPPGDTRLVAFLGGTIGNLAPAPRAVFLDALGAVLRPGDTLLLGTDLVKAGDRLEAAYDDAAGVTAEFNRNVLRVINRALGADFVPERFDHVARWDPDSAWIEMRLRARGAQRVVVPELELTVEFADQEEVRTEIEREVHPPSRRSRAGRGRFHARALVDRPGRRLRPVARDPQVSALPGGRLATTWRAELADHRVVPLDAAGCACPSRAVLDATVGHLRREAEIGGYAAEFEASGQLERLRGRLGELVGLDAASVALAPNATLAFTALFGAWPLRPGARVGVIPSEYESNRLVLDAVADRRGFTLVVLPTDEHRRLRLDALEDRLRAGLDLVTFPVVASHRGVVQPAAAAVALAHAAGVPVVLDVAQAAGHVPLGAVGADAYVGTGRKWLRGPRGTGWIAAGRDAGARLDPEYPSLTGRDASGVARLATGEGSIAARVGWGLALEELTAADPEVVFTRVAALGVHARARLDGCGGWQAQEPLDEPSGVVTLAHPELDPVACAARLLAAGITTTAIPAGRVPIDLRAGVLRISLHAYCDEGDVDRLEFSLRR